MPPPGANPPPSLSSPGGAARSEPGPSAPGSASAGSSPAPPILPKFQQLLERYLVHLEAERGASPYTILNYRRDCEGFLQFATARGVASLAEVDRRLLREWLADLQGRGIVRASQARKLTEVRSFLRYLVREAELARNVAQNVSGPKVPKRLPRFLSDDQVRALLDAPDAETPQGLRDRAILELLYAAGLRVSELVGLNLSHVDLESGEARVWGKGSKERLTLLGKAALAALARYLRDARPRLLHGRTSQALFVSRLGERMTTRSVELLLEKYRKQVGLSDAVTPHTLRHTFATHMLDGGADLRVLQELLGHSKLATTQVYTHVSQSQARRVYLSAHPHAEASDE